MDSLIILLIGFFLLPMSINSVYDLKNEIDNLDTENRKKYKSPYTIDYIYVSEIDLYAK